MSNKQNDEYNDMLMDNGLRLCECCGRPFYSDDGSTECLGCKQYDDVGE